MLSACDREAAPEEAPSAAAPSIETPPAAAGDEGEAMQPEEIYLDLTAFAWYREGRPLVHNGRSYMPQSDPVPVELELKKAGTYEGVSYYVADGTTEPVYTLYVPVYYRYWQRFTAPPGA